MKQIAVALSLWLTAVSSGVAAGSSATFNGVWQLEGPPITRLRTSSGDEPPLRPAARRQYLESVKLLARGDRSFDPGQQCKPLGNPRLLWEEGWPFDIQMSAGRILIGYTWNGLHRLIDVAPGEPEVAGPTYLGTSTARIEGNTLIVRSAGYHDTTLLDAAGLPHSSELSMVERYRLIDGGQRLELRIRFSDAVAYTRPWEVRAIFRRLPEGRIREDVCQLRQRLYSPATP